MQKEPPCHFLPRTSANYVLPLQLFCPIRVPRVQQQAKMSPQILEPRSVPDPGQYLLSLTATQLAAGGWPSLPRRPSAVAVIGPQPPRAAQTNSCRHRGDLRGLCPVAAALLTSSAEITATFPQHSRFRNCFEALRKPDHPENF